MDPGSALEKMDPDPGQFFKIFWIFKHSQRLENLLNFFFSIDQIWVLRAKKFLFQFLDPDTGSQNLADPTDPGLKHLKVQDKKGIGEGGGWF